jgi:hypothetical protein
MSSTATNTAGYVVIGPELWAAHLDESGRFWEPRCEATTRQGRRCRNTIFEGQAYFWGGGDQPLMAPADKAVLDDGLCRTHRG